MKPAPTLDHARQPTEHDYRAGRWGHDVAVHAVVDGGRQLRVSAWGYGVQDGDTLLLANTENRTGFSRYRVTEKRGVYMGDPPDMWHATLVWVPACRDCGSSAPEAEAHVGCSKGPVS